MVEYPYVKTRREDVPEIKENQIPIVRFFMRWATRLNVAVFRASKGRLMNRFIGGYPVCIVTTRGAKTGKVRRIALIHLPYGPDKKLLVASQGGMPRNPVWYYNIKANPGVKIMVGGEEKDYIARQVSDEEKAELWPHLLSLYPDFDEYQARTDRNIPVFMCEPGSA
ncbi:MAG: nitroreductase family deazaflavin-dependent oxidoreductase [Halioglobus sp.]|nr:nitroreductase family deazaflavin-dependent oxidoreductase [Halioglobus sp.]